MNYGKLDLQRFKPGAMVRCNGGFHVVADPFRMPFYALKNAFSPVGSFMDKLRVLSLRNNLLQGPPESTLNQQESTVLQYLQEKGFTRTMIERFFRPFYQGIFLAPLSEQSARVFAYVFRMFSAAPVSLPRHGIGQFTAQLANSLPGCVSIELGRQVKQIAINSVRVLNSENGAEEIISTPATIVATDGPAAVRLLEGKIKTNTSRGSICIYFESPSPPPIEGPILVLNGIGEEDGPVNNMFVPTSVSKSYAPEGKTLISTTIVGNAINKTDADLEEAVREQMSRWFGEDEVKQWWMLRVYRIPHSQTAQDPDFIFQREVTVGDGIFVCGDHRNAPTVNGALSSGQLAAKEAIEYLSESRIEVVAC